MKKSWLDKVNREAPTDPQRTDANTKRSPSKRYSTYPSCPPAPSKPKFKNWKRSSGDRLSPKRLFDDPTPPDSPTLSALGKRMGDMTVVGKDNLEPYSPRTRQLLRDIMADKTVPEHLKRERAQASIGSMIDFILDGGSTDSFVSGMGNTFYREFVCGFLEMFKRNDHLHSLMSKDFEIYASDPTVDTCFGCKKDTSCDFFVTTVGNTVKIGTCCQPYYVCAQWFKKLYKRSGESSSKLWNAREMIQYYDDLQRFMSDSRQIVPISIDFDLYLFTVFYLARWLYLVFYISCLIYILYQIGLRR